MAEAVKRAYFISDAHVGAGTEREEKEKVLRLLRFLDREIDCSAELFILGDLYDYWFEYKTVIPRAGFQLTAKLIELARSGTPIVYIGGNHDYWLEAGFLKDAGIDFKTGSVELTLGGESFFLAHGDTLWNHGAGQRIVNGVLRNPFNIRLYRWLHPDLGIGLARFASRISRRKSENQEFDECDKYLKFAEDQFARGITNVIIGHTHRPVFKKQNGHTYVNTGDWISHNTYGYFDGESLMLREWKE